MVLQNLHNVWIVTGFPSYIVHFFGCLLGVSVILISGFNLVRLVVFKIPVTELIKIRSGEDESAELRTD